MLDMQDESWIVPEKYNELTPREKTEALRACILTFLNQNGPASKSAIRNAIRASQNDSVKKSLDYLVHTRQIYSERYGSRETIYFPNGRLAHTLYQGKVRVGRKEYIIRTYFDRLSGRNLTITEYKVNFKGEIEPKGGIRIDAVDLDDLVRELTRINDLLKGPIETEDRTLIER